MIRLFVRILRNKERVKRHLQATLSSVYLLAESAFLAAIGTKIWAYFWTRGWHLSPESEVRLSTIILVLAGVFAIAAAITLTQTVDKTTEMSTCVRMNDEVRFMVLRDMRIPRRMHLVLTVFGAGIVALVSIFGYSDLHEGIITVFVTYLVLLVYASATLELQEPLQSSWFLSHAPKNWLEQDADEFFERRKTLAAQKGYTPPS